MLLWTELSPISVEAALGDEGRLAEVFRHVDQCVKTSCSDSFWSFSNGLWQRKELAEMVGLRPTPPTGSQEESYLNTVLRSAHQVHREHKPTCWKNERRGGINKCRMAMPAPPQHGTGVINLALKRTRRESDDNDGIPDDEIEVVVEPFAGGKNMCHHVPSCDCENVVDFKDSNKAVYLATNRPERDTRVVGYNPTLSMATCSNTAIVPLGTLDQVMPIVLYLIKYLAKDKVENIHAALSLRAAQERFRRTSR
jgi:hypothetical protein